eukprot:12887483-Prorocentrum_lima.AAC.1
MEQININMELMSHSLPWHMLDFPVDATYETISSRLRKFALNMHPDKDFNATKICKMAGYRVECFPRKFGFST